MAKTSDSSSRPRGNDGTWFLRAVGVKGEVTTLDDVDAETTSDAVRQLWDAGDGDPLADWSPNGLSRTVERDRSFRWSVVVAVAIVVAAAVAVALWLPGTSERRADVRAEALGSAVSEIRSDLPEAQNALAVITEPASDASQFAELLPVITDLRADAGIALDLAAQPLPSAWPLAPDAPFDQLAPFRDQVSAEATSAQAIARRLGDVLTYRSLVSQFMLMGELPTEAADLAELNTRLATVGADSTLIVAELPDDAALVDHRTTALALVDRFGMWQLEYVDALRNGDTTGASALAAELTTELQRLDALMLDALATIRSEVDAEILDLAANIDAIVAGLGAT